MSSKLTERLGGELVNLVKSFPAKVGVGFKDLKTGVEYYINGRERFLTASVFKVFVLIELYNQVVRGELDLRRRYRISEKVKVLGSGILKELDEGLQPTLRDLAKLMMILSDNTATDIIMELLGKERINRTLMEVLGLRETRVYLTTGEILLDMAGANDWETARRNFEEMKINKGGRWETDLEYNNVTTPEEMVRTLELLYRGKVLTPEACREILEIMKACQTGEARIKRYLPHNVKVAHKTGTMPGVVNDAGIVFTEKGDYVLVVFINGLNYEKLQYVPLGEEFIAQISKKVYDVYMALT